jgi:hypothetical protein
MNSIKIKFFNMLKEYIYLMLGIIISSFACIILSYVYFLDNKHIYKIYSIDKTTFKYLLFYISLSGYMLSLTIPIFGLFYNKSYLYFFRFLVITHIFWIITFVFEERLLLFLEVLLVCFPLPISYYFAMRENAKHWNAKSLTHNYRV